MANFFTPTKKKQKTGQVLTESITHVNHAGHGVGRYKKLPLFVEGALAGERVEVKIIEKKSKYVKGQLLSVLQESEERVTPACKHFHVCGGCDLQHLSYDAQITLKKQNIATHFARNGFSDELPWQESIVSQPLHYRRKARIGVQYNKHGEAIVGFRQKFTNHLAVIKRCPVLVEPISDIFPKLTTLINANDIEEAIGHVEVIVTDNITLILRVLKKLSATDITRWQEQAEQHQWCIMLDDGKSVSPLNTSNNNEALSYNIPSDVTITFTPQDFIQVNHGVNQQMIATAMQWLDLSKQDVVLDLFCGLGNFSLPIAKHAGEVVGIEGVQQMVDSATNNALRNELAHCHFYQADLNSNWNDSPSSEKWLKKPYNKVVLDPARAGAFEAVSQLENMKIPTLLYISCDVSTLARDAGVLAKQGYKIKKVALMDMFSQTKHVETMVLFTL